MAKATKKPVRMKSVKGWVYVDRYGRLRYSAEAKRRKLLANASEHHWYVDGLRIARVELREVRK